MVKNIICLLVKSIHSIWEKERITLDRISASLLLQYYILVIGLNTQGLRQIQRRFLHSYDDTGSLSRSTCGGCIAHTHHLIRLHTDLSEERGL